MHAALHFCDFDAFLFFCSEIKVYELILVKSKRNFTSFLVTFSVLFIKLNIETNIHSSEAKCIIVKDVFYFRYIPSTVVLFLSLYRKTIL
jgi:hypothetical protein